MSAGAAPRGLRALARLPLPLAHALGALLGWLVAYLPSRHRAITRRNLALCFPALGERERRVLARRSLVETGKTVLEMPRVWLTPGETALGLIREVSGEELVREAVAGGRGAIAVSPHLGNWELCGLYLSARYGITSLYRPPRASRWAAMVRAARERMGARLVPTDAKGIKTLYQALGRNEMIGILPDQDPRQGAGAFAPFFGVAANTMTLLPRLVGKSGAPVIFCFAERLPRGQGFHLHFLPAPEGIGDSDPQVAAAALNRGVEACVRLRPEQYQWSYKRFRTRPEGEPPLY